MRIDDAAVEREDAAQACIGLLELPLLTRGQRFLQQLIDRDLVLRIGQIGEPGPAARRRAADVAQAAQAFDRGAVDRRRGARGVPRQRARVGTAQA